MAPRQWPARPIRCTAVERERGEPSWQTRSTAPMSMPSSSEAVATMARTSPARRRRSASRRTSRSRLPWWASTVSVSSRSRSSLVSRSAIRRVFTKTSVVRCSAMSAAIRLRRSSITSCEATAPSSVPGTSTARSNSRRPGTATISGPSSPGLRNPATSSTGRTVAERPRRCSFRPAARSSRSRVRARWLPRRFPARAWISSTMTVRAVDSACRLRGEVSRRKRDSGVVMRRCGGRRVIRARSAGGVSPVRRAARISGVGAPAAAARRRISASGISRFSRMSALRAFSGET